ncbi:leucine-rich repeat serine/threonine-protein kinase 2-like [Glandiceps talaboti]
MKMSDTIISRSRVTEEARTREIISILSDELFTTEDIYETTNELIQLTEQDHNVTIMEENDAHSTILDLMESFPDNGLTQQIGCIALSAMMRRSEQLKRCICNEKKVDRRLINVLDDHSQDVLVVSAAIETVTHLASDGKCRKRILNDNMREIIVEAMGTFEGDTYLQINACKALTQLLKKDSNAQLEMLISKDYSKVIQAIENHYDSLPLMEQALGTLHTLLSTDGNAKYFVLGQDTLLKTMRKTSEAIGILISGYKLFQQLAYDDNSRDALLQLGVHTSIIHDMLAFPEDTDLILTGCDLIQTLAHNTNIQSVVIASGSTDVILRALHTFPGDCNIQSSALLALEKTGDVAFKVSDSFHDKACDTWLYEISTAMKGHPENTSVQDSACLALSKLLGINPHVVTDIGSDDNQHPIDIDLLECLMRHWTDVDVFQSVCSAIYATINGNGAVRSMFIQQCAIVPVLYGLGSHLNNHRAQRIGCNVLWGLVQSSENDITERFSDEALLRNVVHTFKEYPNDSEIVEDVIVVIASLLKYFSGLLLGTNVLDTVLECMEQYCSCLAVQNSGFVLLRDLIKEGTLDDSQLHTSLPRMVVNAMVKFSESVDLQIEGWKTIGYLVQISEQMSQAFASIGYGQLINIIFLHTDNTDLLTAARNCVGNSSVCQTTKDYMLISASKSGTTKEVECLLQLGADVNTGSNSDTPLCYACSRANNQDMVECILKREGNGLKSALHICLTEGHLDSAGLLLAHIGIEKQAGGISWENLKLNTFHLKWFDKKFSEETKLDCGTNRYDQAWFAQTTENSDTLRTTQLDGRSINFPAIYSLNLSRNNLYELPAMITEVLPNLKELDLRENAFEIFPFDLLNLRKLLVLDLSRNKLEKTHGYNNETSSTLLDLNLSKNQFDKLPRWIESCAPNLESLSFARNNIETLFEEPLQLASLTKLNLGYNKLKTIPSEFLSELMYLETLDLQSNHLQSLPDESANKLPNLKKVLVSRNKLAQSAPMYIPKFILRLQALTNIDLRWNELENIPPPASWRTHGLEELLLSHNNIKELKLVEGIHKWSSLRRLDVSHNKLKEIPRELGQIISLGSLNFSHNDAIRRLPDELGNLNNVWELDLKGLKLEYDSLLPKDGRPKDIISFLHERLIKAVPNCRMKLMVVGYGGRGKTTLLKQIQKKRLPKYDLATVGVEVEEWRKTKGIFDKITKKGSKHDMYCLTTWDFGGQEDFYSTHPMFLSERSLYLVVYDITKGVQELMDLKPWLLTIMARSPRCPVILVGTHADKLPEAKKDEIINVTKQHIASLYGSMNFPNLNMKDDFMVCATSPDDKVKELRRYIFEVIDEYKVGKQPVIGQKIPLSYVKLEELVVEKAKTKNVLTYEEFEELAREGDVKLDDVKLPHALRFLHQSGLLLHFEDPVLGLRDLVFINPEWLCKMMARIVTVREINPFIDKHGVLQASGLEILLRDCNLSIEEYQGLMKKFEIAVPKGDDELLIPCRMPEKRPDITVSEVEGQNLLTRRYKMQYIPIDFWSKLIGRLITFSRTMMEKAEEQHEYWREGIYVKWSEEAFFLVEPESNHSNCFSITAPCTKDGIRLFGYVVDHTDDLFEEWYPGLQGVLPTGDEALERLVPCPLCKDVASVHHFTLEELTYESRLNETIRCAKKDIAIELKTLAPDVVFEDIDIKNMDQEDLSDFENMCLGSGAFGSVHKISHKNKDVAVKTFHDNGMGTFHTHRMLRQEVTILRKMSHVSIVSMLGVGLRPKRRLVMELAPLGCLRSVMEGKKTLSRRIKQRILLQVAEGLVFLHEQELVYRDLKPDNVLVYSLSVTDVINAKISDYGISRFATPLGLTSSEGTAGYRAPEIGKKDILYNNKVDVYSFGILLCELVVRNSAFTFMPQTQPLLPLTSMGCAPWPDVQDLINQCTECVPEKRPSSRQVFNRLNSIDLICLERVIQVSDKFKVTSTAIRKFQKNGEEQTELWFGGGESRKGFVAWSNITNGEEEGSIRHVQQSEGLKIAEERIESVLSLGSDTVVFSNSQNKMWTCDSQTHKCEVQLPELEDAVLCLQHYDGYFDEGVVFAGMANGKLALYSVAKLKSVTHGGRCQPDKMINVSDNCKSIRCMKIARGKLWMGCGGQVMSILLDGSLGSPVLEVDTQTSSYGLVTHIAVDSKLWLCRQKSSTVEVWNLDENCNANQRINVIKCEDIIRKAKTDVRRMDCYVKSLLLQSEATLWIGTESGHILLLDSSTYEVISIIRRYIGPVKVIISSDDYGVSKSSPFVLTVGTGFIKRPGQDAKIDPCATYALLWDTNTAEQVKHLSKYTRRRQQHVAENCIV